MEISTKSISQSLNLYSVFGYLLPGFFLTTLFILDYDFCTIIRYYSKCNSLTVQELNAMNLKVHYIMNFFSTGTMTDFKFIPFIIYIFFCYLLGHLVSAFSSLILEKLIIKQLMGYPSTILVSGNPVTKKWLFGSYRRTLKPQIINEIKKTIKKTFDYDVHKEDYYWLCYSYIITTRPYLASRIHHFVNLYGFSRNVTGALIIYLICRFFIFFLLLGSAIDRFSILSMALMNIAAVSMFWNYLKLFKRQAVDIYYLFLAVHNDSNNTIQTIAEA